MKRLILKNPVLRFKQRYLWGGQISWNLLMYNSPGEIYNREKIQPTIKKTREIVLGVEHLIKKANKRNSKLSGILLELYNKGFFKGIKDRHGKEATYKTAVDGINGPMTRLAIENAKKAGYYVDSKLGLIKKNIKQEPIVKLLNLVNNKSNLSEIFRMTRAAQTGGFKNNDPSSLLFKDSENIGKEAILDHLKKFPIGNKGIIDKINKTLEIYKGDSLVAKYPITTGLNKGDGMAPLSAKFYSESPRTTGAGVFTILSLKDSPYMGLEPLFRLIPDSIGGLALSLHSPSGNSRIEAIKNKKGSTYGCINGFCGVAKEIYDKGLLTDKDTIYVLPEIEGNNIIEKNGRIQMSWGNNNPDTYTDSRGNIRYFRYNNKK